MSEKLPRLFTPRLSYKPFEYPEFFEAGWTPQSNAFWLHTKIPMSRDVKDWNENLSENEKQIISKILRGFAQTECTVLDYWSGTVAKVFPKYEIVHMATCFAYFETIHASAYFYLNETLGLDKDSETFMDDKTTADKLEMLINFNAENSNGEIDYKRLGLSLAVFSGVAEGLILFSSFAVLMSFMTRNLVPGIIQQMTWSVRDESLHSQMGCQLFQQMCLEIPDLLDEELSDQIYEAFELGLKLETNFINQVFQGGDLPNLSKEHLINFMRYRANDRLRALGLSGKYEVDRDMMDDMMWFDMAISDVQKKDFFVVKPTEYSKSTFSWDIDSID